MTRLERLVCAVLAHDVVKPLHHKLSLKVFGNTQTQPKTLEELDRFSEAYDREVATRAVSIAMMLEQKISDAELKLMMEPICAHPSDHRNGKICNACGELIDANRPHEFASDDQAIFKNLCVTCGQKETWPLHRV